MALQVIAVGMAIANIGLQAAVVNPGITDRWNKLTAQSLTQEDNFIEQGIRVALQAGATDQITVPDMFDTDQDTVFGFRNGRGEPLDKVGRFGIYYTKILNAALPPPIEFAKEFREALADFIYENPNNLSTPDNWALYDPPPECPSEHACCYVPGGPPVPSECNPCCIPNIISDPSDPSADLQLRPECCDTGTEDECGVSTTCQSLSPYGLDYDTGSGSHDFRWIYDPFYENRDNAFLSFREMLGRDDENSRYYKDAGAAADPNGVQMPVSSVSTKPEGWNMEDTTGFFTNDIRPGVFSFFYKLADWGVGLSFVNPSLKPLECHWCDPRWDDCVDCSTLDVPISFPNQLNLPLDPCAPTVIYNKTYVVDGLPQNSNRGQDCQPPVTVNLSNAPPLAVDSITVPANPGIIASNDSCASYMYAGPEDSGLPANSSNVGFWKKGSDFLCSVGTDTGAPETNSGWPYDITCEKFAATCTIPGTGEPTSCSCGEGATPRNLFREDVLDGLIHGLQDFILDANFILSKTDFLLAMTFRDWYNNAAEWIEPLWAPGDQGVSCYTCRTDSNGNPLEGRLHVWWKEIQQMRDRLIFFRDNGWPSAPANTKGYKGQCTGSAGVWCVPSTDCTDTTAAELATFDYNVNGIRGDMEDVIACLQYNIEGGDVFGARQLRDCLINCNTSNCSRSELPSTSPLGDSYTYPSGPVSCANWQEGNPWYDAVVRNLQEAAAYPPGTNLGNAVRYQACAETCHLRDCMDLPRSLVPGHSPGLFVNPGAARQAHVDLFLNCIDRCSAGTPGAACTVDAPVFSDPGTCLVQALGIDPNNPTAPPSIPLWTGGSLPWYRASGPTTTPGLNEYLYRSYPSGPGTPGVFNMATCTVRPINCGTFRPDIADPWYDMLVGTGQNVGPSEVQRGNMRIANDACNLQKQSALVSQDGWLTQTRQNAIESVNQVAKFSHRLQFLKPLYDELKDAIEILEKGEQGFYNFLTCDTETDAFGEEVIKGAACQLIQDRINYEVESFGIDYQMIYGWQGETPQSRLDLPPTDPNHGQGYWHIVKVDARVPQKCDNACSPTQEPNKPQQWPRVITYTKSWGTKRCYKLVDTDGSVKMRVTRFDEDKVSKAMTFPGGQRIWDFHFFHPTRGKFTGGDAGLTVSNLASQCDGIMIRDPNDANFPFPAQFTDMFKGAFIMNRRILSPREAAALLINEVDIGDIDDFSNVEGEDSTDADVRRVQISNVNCWDFATELLSHGATSETCAQYYMHSGIRSGLSFKFVDCKEF